MGLPLLLKLILQPKVLGKIADYVFKDNSLDVQMKAMIKEVGQLKKDIKKLKKGRK